MITDRSYRRVWSMNARIAFTGTVILSTVVLVAYQAHSPRRASLSADRTSVDFTGHRRGVVQVELMRQIMADNARSSLVDSPEAIDEADAQCLPSSNHPLVGEPAPDFDLTDQDGRTWRLSEHLSKGPVVVVFYLGMTCMACVGHLMEVDSRLSELRNAGALIVAVSPDESEFTRDRFRRFGALAFPALADPDRAVATSYGAWRPVAGRPDGESLHSTFLIGSDGHVHWAWVDDQPFTDVKAILREVERTTSESLQSTLMRSVKP